MEQTKSKSTGAREVVTTKNGHPVTESLNSGQTTLGTDVPVGRPGGGGDGGEGAAGEDAVGRQEVDPLGPLPLKHVQGEPEGGINDSS